MRESGNEGMGSKLIVDIAPLFEDHWTGIPIFTRRLVQALMRCGDLDIEFAFRLCQVPRDAVLSAIRAGTGTSLRGDFERNAAKGHPLIDPKAHILYPSVKEVLSVSEHEASTIHDLSSLVMPEFHERANVDYHMKNLARQLTTDEVVFCISEATRAALTLAYPSAAGKIKVLPQYVDWPQHFAAMDRNLPPPLSRRYVAVIGTVEPRKNLSLLLRALADPKIRDSDVQFVIMGKQGWRVEEFMASLNASDRERLVFLGYVTEFMKYRFLNHAEFLVFPSLYEGFGIPALEAMSLGKPVLASMSSSFPDLVGEGGLYFDPFSVSSFAAAFDELTDDTRRAVLATQAVASAAAYDQKGMARPVLEWVRDS